MSLARTVADVLREHVTLEVECTLLEYVHRHSTLDVVRQVVREELASYGPGRRPKVAVRRIRARAAHPGR